MVAWFKHDIPAWMDGTEDLDAEPYRAYHVICQLIYLNEGPIALNEHGIAGRCKQSIRTFRAALETLLERGKLTLSDGRLDNSRAEKELENVSENRVNASKGGQKSAEVRKSNSNSLKNNNTDKATLQEDRSLKTRLEETREEKKDTSLRSVDDWPDNYGDLFWQDYPRKTGKLAAMKKLAAIRKSGIVTFAELIAGVRRYAATNPEPQFTKHPTTWLNAGCWADETQPGATNGNRTGNPRPSGHDAILAVAARKARELDRNDPMAGPTGAPGFAFGDGFEPAGSVGNRGAAEPTRDDHERAQPDAQRIREGEIIPPDKNAAGFPGRREFV